VAWDWVNQHLYWTDAQENTVNRLNGSSKEVLVHEELDEPRAIALSPCDGKFLELINFREEFRESAVLKCSCWFNSASSKKENFSS